MSLLWKLNKCFIEPNQYLSVWVTKRDLYGYLRAEYSDWKLNMLVHEEEETYLKCKLNGSYGQPNLVRSNVTDLVCNMSVCGTYFNSLEARVAYTSTHKSENNSWYFDSGCSRHMTSDKICLRGIHKSGWRESHIW